MNSLTQLQGKVRTQVPFVVDIVNVDDAGASEEVSVHVEWAGERPEAGEEVFVRGELLMQRDSVVAVRAHFVQRALGGVN